jgi:hypothetical protein
MRTLKTPLLIAAMLIASLAASAQESKSAAKSRAEADPVPHATVEGCLREPASGKFVLVRTSGKKYYLSGKLSLFDGLNGNEIRVYGELKIANDPLAAMKQTQAEMAAGPPEEIVVEEVTKIDDSCEHGAAGSQKPAVVGSGGNN